MTNTLGKDATLARTSMLNKETSEAETEWKELKKRNRDMKKAERKNKRIKVKKERERGKGILAENGYTRPVVFLNKKTGVKTVHDPRTGHSYTIGPDGRCTNGAVRDAYLRQTGGSPFPYDGTKTARTVYGSRPSPDQLAKWEKDHNRCDIEGIDAPLGSITVLPNTGKKKTAAKKAPVKKTTGRKPSSAENKSPKSNTRQITGSDLVERMNGVPLTAKQKEHADSHIIIARPGKVVQQNRKPASVRSNSKEVIEKDKRHILSYFEPRNAGYGTREEQFVDEVDSLKNSTYSGSNKKMYPTTEAAIKQMVDGACIGEPYTYDRAKYLNKAGLKKYDADKDDLNRYSSPVNDLYSNLMVRDGTKLYDEIKAGRTASAKKPTGSSK